MKLQMVDANFNEIEIESRTLPPGCKINIPKIYVSELARAKIHGLAKFTYNEFKEKLEVFCYLLGERMGEALDIVVPHVEVTGAYGEVTPGNIRGIKPEIKEINEKRLARNDARIARNDEIRKENDAIRSENEKIRELNAAHEENGTDLIPEKEEIPLLSILKPLMIVGWAHSHVDFKAFSSSTDNVQHENLHRELRLSNLMEQAYDPIVPKLFHVISITVNIFGHEHGVVKGSAICGLELRQFEPVEIIQIETDEGHTDEDIINHLKALKEEIKVKVHLLRDRPKKKTRYIEPVHSYRRTTMESSLDKYFKEAGAEITIPTLPDGSILEAIKETITLRKIKNDDEIQNSMKQLEKVYKQKPKTLQLLTKIVDNVIWRSREMMIEGVENIMKNLEEPDDTTTTIYPEGDEYKEDECIECGVALTDENFVGDYNVDGSPLCIECNVKIHGDEVAEYCSEPDCNIRLTPSTTFEIKADENDDLANTRFVCEDHLVESVEDGDNDEGESSFDYFDEDGVAKKCVKCNKPIVIGENYEEEFDEDGMPLCTGCAAPENVDEEVPEVQPPSPFTTRTERRDTDPGYIS